MDDFSFFLVLHDAHLAMLRSTNEGGLVPVGSGEDDWIPLKSLDQARNLIETGDQLAVSSTVSERWAYLITDRGMQDELSRLLQAGIPLYAQHWHMERYETLVKGQGGELDYPLPSLEALIPLLQALHIRHSAEEGSIAVSNEVDAGLTPQTPADKESVESAAPSQDLAPALSPTEPLELLEPLDGEQLLYFMPALFRQSSTLISGVDLALLTGRIEPIAIVQRPELNESERDKRQREFRTLPLSRQRQIVHFVRALSTHAQEYPELQNYFETLE